MCGITGLIKPKDKESIKKMTEAILHRGPDDEGFYSDENIALGMRRLSIIDLAKGHQPITSQDERYLIFFNGEIYNYKEIKKELNNYQFKTDSDTEVILAGYIKFGEGVLNKLRGMFAFAIYDKEKKELFLARDFFGIKPLYYLKNGNQIVSFSSEIKSFLAISGFKPEVNDEAVFNYLSYQYNPLEETFFKNVYKLPPAHYMRVNTGSGEVEMKRYWQFKFNPNENLDEKETAEEILETMKDSVNHHIIADVPVGSFLSGGIDSSIIVTLMQKIRGDKVKTFTVGFDSPTGEFNEGDKAKETSEPLGTEHREISVSPEEYFKALPDAVWHFDEPVADPSAIGLYFLAREARKHVKVVLSGEGADELFGGYNIYLAPFAYRKLAWLPKSIINLFLKLPFEYFGKNYLRRVSSKLQNWYIGNASVFKADEVRNLWKSKVSTRQVDTLVRHLYREVDSLSDSTKMQHVDINTWLVGDILAKADKMTMAHSLELRVPFLDTKVAHLAASLPDRFKWRGGVTKYLLREAFKKVLPESTRNRKKLGFPTPVRNWFTKERTSVYETILKNPYIKSHMDSNVIRKLIDDHTSQKIDNSRKIYLLLMLALWYNTFIHGRT